MLKMKKNSLTVILLIFMIATLLIFSAVSLSAQEEVGEEVVITVEQVTDVTAMVFYTQQIGVWILLTLCVGVLCYLAIKNRLPDFAEEMRKLRESEMFTFAEEIMPEPVQELVDSAGDAMELLGKFIPGDKLPLIARELAGLLHDLSDGVE